MTRQWTHSRLLCVVLALLAWPVAVEAQESIQAAQSLYASASYDEALAVLDRLQHQSMAPADARAVQQNRALCLLALGRSQDAEVAIAAVVNADPAYRPDETSASPRVRAAFKEVRSRLLPGIIQARYNDARALYDKKSWADAAKGFKEALALSTDPDLSEAQTKELGEFRVLADGFLKLAEAAATPPPPPAPAPESTAAPVPAAAALPAIDFDRVFNLGDPDVTPPVTIRQEMPRVMRTSSPLVGAGVIEIIIGKNGAVERATIIQRMQSAYDRMVLDATKNWRYRPAEAAGQPVRFRKQIRITFQ
jgi:TonB family protein